MSALIRILFVEDHSMVAAGLTAVVAQTTDLEVVATASSVADALAAVEAHNPDVVCMDYVLPDGRGTDAAADIRRRWPDTQVVMLTASDDDKVLAAAVDAGCIGFLAKGTGRTEELLDALRRAAAGEISLTGEQLRRLVPRFRRDHFELGADLTARERDVLSLLATGTTTPDIASALHISFATARNHIQNILTKLDAHSKLEAVAIAVRAGIVDAG